MEIVSARLETLTQVGGYRRNAWVVITEISTYYNYSQCFTHYTERIINLRQAKIRREVIVAKPVLMLALIDGIESGVFTDNRFTLNEWLNLMSNDIKLDVSLFVYKV